MTFGKKTNLPSTLATTSSLTYQELLDIWKKRHEEYLQKGKVALKKTKECLKRQQNASNVRLNPIFEIGDLVQLHNDSKVTKLERE